MPIAASAIIRHFAYYEYRKVMKEKRLNQTHKREIMQMIDLENELLSGSESKLIDKLYSLAAKHSFDSHPDLYAEINGVYGNLSSLCKKRKERIEIAKMDSGVFRKMSDLAENRTLSSVSKEYPEFMSILKIIEHIQDNINTNTFQNELELLDEIKEVSRPHVKSVIESNPLLVSLYNELVDIFGYFVGKHSELHEMDEIISKMEREFTDKIKLITKKAALLDLIQSEPNFTALYNNLVDLFNHYSKKMELGRNMTK